MSDMAPGTPAEPAPTANPMIANATQALALKELGETVTAVKKQVKTLWITVVAIAVVTLALLVLTLVPSLRLGLGGRGNFQRGQFNGSFQGAPGATGGPSQGSGTTTP